MAPGTDGLGYSLWAEAPDVYPECLDQLAAVALQNPDAVMPEVLASTATATILKADMAQADPAARCTSSVRPMTSMWTSAKTLQVLRQRVPPARSVGSSLAGQSTMTSWASTGQ